MELFDLYTADRVRTGKTIVRGEDVPSGYYRIVVFVCVFDSEGRLLIQQRQPFKPGWSNYWDVSVGGSAVSGENSQQAASRELYEELGIRHDFTGERPFYTFYYEDGWADFYFLHMDVDPDSLFLQEEEVQAAKYATKDEVLAMIDEGCFIPVEKGLISFLFHLGKGKRSIMTRGDDSAVPAKMGG